MVARITSKTLFLMLLLALLMLQGASAEEAPIVIGVAYPVAEHDADSFLREGIELAVDTINASGGVLGQPLALDIRDDEGNASLAMQIAQTYYEQGISAVIGHWSSNVCYYVEDIYEKNNVVMITPAAVSHHLFKYDYSYIFRMIPSSMTYAETIAADMIERGVRRIAVYFYDNEYGRDFADAIEDALYDTDVLVLDRITSLTPGNTKSVVDRWAALGCEAVVMVETMPNLTQPLELVRQNVPSMLVYGIDNFDRSNFEEILGDNAKGLLMATYPTQMLDQDFVEAFEALYGREPDIHAVTGYESVYLIRDAMEASGSTDGEAIAAYISSLSEYRTISSIISYDLATKEFVGQQMDVITFE